MARPGTLDADIGARTEVEPLAPDLNRLERKLLGSGYRMVCRHPDIDGDPIDAPTRSCLIDSGQPEQCEMSQIGNPERVTHKTACDYWRRKAAREPTRLSIAEGLGLIAALRGSGSTSAPHSSSVLPGEDL